MTCKTPGRLLLGARGHFEQMVAELGFHRPLDFIQRSAENNLVELRHHLARTEASKIAAATTGRTLGVLHGERDEIFAVDNALLEIVALIRGVHEDVTGISERHGKDFLLQWLKIDV